MVKVKEIFTSIQGEGIFAGYKQLFIRFCGCNLNCAYCDTNYEMQGAKEYTAQELIDICNCNSDCHSVSLTGGEPLLHADIIKELGQANLVLPLYLETNGTQTDELKKVIQYITYVAADIKLPSSTGLKPLWQEHDAFFDVAVNAKSFFAKAVFDNNISDDEIEKMTKLCNKYNTPLVLQPKMNGNILNIESNFMQTVLDKCLEKHKNTRLIPQMHKFIGVI